MWDVLHTGLLADHFNHAFDLPDRINGLGKYYRQPTNGATGYKATTDHNGSLPRRSDVSLPSGITIVLRIRNVDTLYVKLMRDELQSTK
jgi:hypothetical protein